MNELEVKRDVIAKGLKVQELTLGGRILGVGGSMHPMAWLANKIAGKAGRAPDGARGGWSPD